MRVKLYNYCWFSTSLLEHSSLYHLDSRGKFFANLRIYTWQKVYYIYSIYIYIHNLKIHIICTSFCMTFTAFKEAIAGCFCCSTRQLHNSHQAACGANSATQGLANLPKMSVQCGWDCCGAWNVGRTCKGSTLKSLNLVLWHVVVFLVRYSWKHDKWVCPWTRTYCSFSFQQHSEVLCKKITRGSWLKYTVHGLSTNPSLTFPLPSERTVWYGFWAWLVGHGGRATCISKEICKSHSKDVKIYMVHKGS